MDISLSFIQRICILYLFTWTIAPVLQVGTVYRLAAVAAAGLWFVIALIRGLIIDRKQAAALIFAVMVGVIAYIADTSFSSVIAQIAIYLFAMGFVMYNFYSQSGRMSELYFMIPIVLLEMAFFDYKTYTGLANNAAIARIVVRDSEEAVALLQQGIGGYGLLYPQVCVAPIIIGWTTEMLKKNKLFFVCGAVWIAAFFLLISRSGYTIAVVTALISVIILFFYHRRSVIWALAVSGVLILSLLLLIVYVDGFRNFLLETFDGTKVASKINDIYMSATSPDMADSLVSRWTKYRRSLEMIFLKYPLIGALWMNNGGGHSAVLDCFAKYGVLGGSAYVMTIFSPLFDARNELKNDKIRRMANAAIISSLFVTVLNTAPYTFSMLLTLLMPCLIDHTANMKGLYDYDED